MKPIQEQLENSDYGLLYIAHFQGVVIHTNMILAPSTVNQ